MKNRNTVEDTTLSGFIPAFLVSVLLFASPPLTGQDSEPPLLNKLKKVRENTEALKVEARTVEQKGFRSKKHRYTYYLDGKKNRFYLNYSRQGTLTNRKISNGKQIWELTSDIVSRNGYRKYNFGPQVLNLTDQLYNPLHPTGYLARFLETPVTRKQISWEQKEGRKPLLKGTYESNGLHITIRLTFKPDQNLPKSRVVRIEQEEDGEPTKRKIGTDFLVLQTNPTFENDRFSYKPDKNESAVTAPHNVIGSKLSGLELQEFGAEKTWSISGDREGPTVLHRFQNPDPQKSDLRKLQQLQSTFGKKLNVIGTGRGNAGKVKTLREEEGISFPLLDEQTGSVPEIFKKTQPPHTMFLDAEGTVQNILSGTNTLSMYIRATTVLTGDRPEQVASGSASGHGNVDVPPASEASSLMDAKGKQLNNFKLQEAGGNKKHDIKDYRGNVVLINIWRTWCGPCRAEIPDLIELSDEYSDKNVVLLGTSDESERKVKGFADKENVNYPMLLEKKGTLPKIYNFIKAVPTTLILDKDGVIRYIKKGAPQNPKNVFGKEIDKLLKK